MPGALLFLADVDIWRKIGSGSFVSLSRLIGGSTTDGLISEHPDSSTNTWYEVPKWPMVLDDPEVPAGTVLEYKIYVGVWSRGTVTVGSHRNSTRSSRCPLHLPQTCKRSCVSVSSGTLFLGE